MKIGYPCINLTNPHLRVNRQMIRRIFQQKGLKGAGELAEQNLLDLLEIIKWNIKNDIYFYRMSSAMFPWMSEYNISDLPNYNSIKIILMSIGDLAKNSNHRLTLHPGQFNILSSDKVHVVHHTIKDINQHAEIMDLMGLPQNHYAKINIHVGSAYNGKEISAKRFIKNFNYLSDSAKKRLTVENEDKLSLFTTEDLHNYIYSETGIPIVFDYLHHLCNPGRQTEKEALELAISTWPIGVQPVVHFVSSKKLYESSRNKLLSHAEYIHEEIRTYGMEFDVMFESKSKDLSITKYKEDYKKI